MYPCAQLGSGRLCIEASSRSFSPPSSLVISVWVARSSARRAASWRGQEHEREDDPDDRDHHQKLDQREAAPGAPACLDPAGIFVEDWFGTIRSLVQVFRHV